jgi:hypothetical protein
MINFSNANLALCISHFVGNATLDEDLTLSNAPLSTNEELSSFMMNLICGPFSKNQQLLHQFRHSSKLELNEVYTFCNAIFEVENEKGFERQDEFVIRSQEIAKQHFVTGTHPKIHAGELIVAYLQDVVCMDEVVDAVAILKLGRPEPFVQMEHKGSYTKIDHYRGIGFGTVDKGVIVFNTHKDRGYILSVLDDQKDKDGSYWSQEFLNVKQLENEFYHTYAYLDLANNFIDNALPESFDVDNLQQIDLKKKTINFFKEKEQFDFHEFSQEVLQQPEIIDKFREYKQETAQNIADEFWISDKATKKQTNNFKKIIKLDKNFHVYVHGKTEYIQKGVDEVTGMNYYKILYQNEA